MLIFYLKHTLCLGELVLRCTHNVCFEEKCKEKKNQIFSNEIFNFRYIAWTSFLSVLLIYHLAIYSQAINKNSITIFQLGNIISISAFAPESQQSAYAKTKTQISCAVIAQLISTFVFATWIVQCLFFLNLKFQASSLQANLCQTWSKPQITGFLMRRLILIISKSQLLTCTHCVEHDINKVGFE